jgi:hypothetical protein
MKSWRNGPNKIRSHRPKNLTDQGRGARPLIDVVRAVRLFAVDCKKPKVACFRPLAVVLDEPTVQKLQAAHHEFRWSSEAELLARKNEGWWLALGHDSKGRPTIFMDREEELVLLHRRSQRVGTAFFGHAALNWLGGYSKTSH